MAYPASDQKPPCAVGCSQAQGPSGASPARSSAHRTPGASDNTSPRSRRSGGLRPPYSGPARPEHRDDLFRLVSLPCHCRTSPICSNLSSRHTQQSGKGQPQPISPPAWRTQDSHCRSNDPRRFPKILPPCRQLDMGRLGGPRGDSASHRLVRVSALAELLHRGDPSIGEGRHNGSIASPTTIFVGAEAVCQLRAEGSRWHHLSRNPLPEAKSAEE